MLRSSWTSWTFGNVGAVALLGGCFAALPLAHAAEELAYPGSEVQPSAAWSEEPSAEAAEPEVPMEQHADEWCGCDDSCQCQCDCGGGLGLCCLDSLIQPSDHCYDDFISPMTNPVFFEDPRNLTEARLIFLNHKVPLNAGGGDIQVYAMQVRAALTERLSLIATKDGYVVSDNTVVDDGWADIAAGFKYLLYSDPASQQLASAGVVRDTHRHARRATRQRRRHLRSVPDRRCGDW